MSCPKAFRRRTSMRKTLRFSTLLLATLLPTLAMGQANTGFPQHGTFSNAGGGIDTIDLSSLNIHLSVPLRSLSPGGMSASLSLEIDSSSVMASGTNYYEMGFGFLLNPSSSASVGILQRPS